ncbi:ABC transporter substrate-binding protein [Nocardia sp. NBC_01503]|uniref:ABC transporter substrate-binding protein n=1 Tax=Nocardia sp. NBC_01503 TaxID=2975997 RepID=UPI002E7C0FDB|nr:ABC transporter substrate-binding protein [Nocardia sp. NBC_01503]WTL34002.1 ABC transporter substrate-binding protein [Nocardia sp. NBC_01503]
MNTRGLWRRAGLGLLALGLVVGTAACGSSDGGGDGSGSVTIEHVMGETVIDGTPKRVVTLGPQWFDAALALGVTPVGYLVPGLTASTKVPWEPAIPDSAKRIEATGDYVEQIAALEPDLILAPAFMADRTMYDKLSKLAPTIDSLSSAQIDPWQDQVTALGKVLRKEPEAAQVIAEVDGKIDAVGARHPGLTGKTFLTCMLTGPAQLMVLADPKDGSAQVFTRLGMTIPANIVEQAPSGGRLALSPERLSDLTSDLLVCGAMPSLEAKFKELPGYNELPAVRHGGISFVDVVAINAINQPTALSVPYVLEKLEPAFANIAGS